MQRQRRIALALASCRPDARILAAELSDEALVYLRRNIAALAPGQVEAVQTDVLTRLPDGVCDLIVSNPPYITGADMQTLSPQVRHEPELALYGGEDGLRFYRQLTRSCYDHLRPDGWSSSRSAMTRAKASRNCCVSGALRRCSVRPIWQVFPGVPADAARSETLAIL